MLFGGSSPARRPASGCGDQRGDSAHLATFGPSRFRRSPAFLGASADGYNSAHLVGAAGRRWLILALDWPGTRR